MRSLLADLLAAVKARAEARLLRRLRSGESSNGRKVRSLKQRITERERIALACIRQLQAQALVLISDSKELKDTRVTLRRLSLTFRRHAAAQHRAHDNPSHRPDDERQFRADCQRIMKRHGIGATEAARIIVQQIAPTLSAKGRADLLGHWPDEATQTDKLADRLRKPPSAARSNKAAPTAGRRSSSPTGRS